MNDNVIKVVWTRQAREALNEILDYRYKGVSTARKIVRKDIITASKEIVFAKQFQKDEIQPQYRRTIVRDYKLLYKSSQKVIYILNVVCTLTAS